MAHLLTGSIVNPEQAPYLFTLLNDRIWCDDIVLWDYFGLGR